MKRLNLFTFLLIFLTFACHKKEFNSYVGTYDCIKSIHSWEPGQPNVYENTAGETVNVLRDKKLIKVFDLFVDIREISPDETYRKGTDDSYQSIRFSDNKIYYLEHTSAGGGGYEISYIGPKILQE